MGRTRDVGRYAPYTAQKGVAHKMRPKRKQGALRRKFYERYKV
jgi:hypothetical protein